jgi:hypothetical protein
MWNKEISIRVFAVLALVIATSLLSATRLSAQTEAVLYSFKPDLSNPVFGVILGPEGVLYGTMSRKQADPSQFNGPRPCFRVSRVLVKDEGSEENYAN